MKPLSPVSFLAITIMTASGCTFEAGEDFGAGGKAMTSSDDPSLLDPMGLVEPTTIATACTQPSDCPSGFCVDGVCCNSACTGLCRACSAAKKRNGSDGTCGYISNGLDPDNECAGTCTGFGGCSKTSILLGIGSACTANTDCSTGFCVDGYCCDSACSGTCKACSALKKGSGSDGTCGNIAATTDPDNECAAGDCNGSGACGTTTGTNPNGAACSSGSTCSSGYCVDGVCCNSSCTAICQACTAAKKGGGPDGVCSNVAGGTDPDNECSFADCNGVGACGVVVRYGNGTPCTSGMQCSSGLCTDGVCCATDCTGTCLRCNAPAFPGTCAFVPDGQPDPNGSPPCNGTCNGTGWCFEDTGGDCAAGSECSSHICNDTICDPVRPANGPLMWLTLMDGAAIAQGNSNGGPVLDLTQISSALTIGSDIHVNGIVTRMTSDTIPQLHHMKLTGGFSAAGKPLLVAWDGNWSYYGYQSFLRTIYRGGVETSYQRPLNAI
ncbi:MAG TPA: hypothetical protein PK156_35860, partial [Polyangium sp.]|nr:hypothetical protein [Polyangium sp.]